MSSEAFNSQSSFRGHLNLLRQNWPQTSVPQSQWWQNLGNTATEAIKISKDLMENAIFTGKEQLSDLLLWARGNFQEMTAWRLKQPDITKIFVDRARGRGNLVPALEMYTVSSLYGNAAHNTAQIYECYTWLFPNLADPKPEKWKEYFSCCHLDINKINKNQLKPLLKGHFECEKSCNCL